jgi:hypothetical protein
MRMGPSLSRSAPWTLHQVLWFTESHLDKARRLCGPYREAKSSRPSHSFVSAEQPDAAASAWRLISRLAQEEASFE